MAAAIPPISTSDHSAIWAPPPRWRTHLAHAVPSGRRRIGCDPGQCRILLNDARRTIDRLRRGIDRIGEPDQRVIVEVQPPQHEPPAALPPARKPYAVDPVGKPNTPRPAPPPESGGTIVSGLHVTNVGTLLDTLA
ncbi:MAG: hypothetical protein ACYSTY_12370 [Planctomycetota bacterium]|jgi:hypothetical protein